MKMISFSTMTKKLKVPLKFSAFPNVILRQLSKIKLQNVDIKQPLNGKNDKNNINWDSSSQDQ